MTWWPGGNARQRLGPQAREAQRLDHRLMGTTRAGTGPAPSQNEIIVTTVVVHGTGPTSGVFIYNGTPGLGNPPQIAEVPTGVTSDPYGNAITSSSILMQGNVITESGGIFRTAATAPLIQLDGPHNAVLVYDASAALKETIAPVATNDGLGNTVQAGFTSYTAGLFAQLIAAGILWGGTGITVAPAIGSGGTAFLQMSSGQTAALAVQAILSLNSAASGALGTALLTGGNLDVGTVGAGLQVKEGTNAKQGTATLAAGTKLVANTSVTANSRIFLTAQDNNSTGALRVSARVAGTSFTITSSNAADTGVVAFQIFEPG